MSKHILIIDDDHKLNTLLGDYFVKFGFQTSAATDPRVGLSMIKNNPPDLIILDVMLPGMDGFEVCKQIRKNYSIPIIMLTARGDVTDRIVGLELGADDYIPKPFEPRELIARIQSVLRRGNSASDKTRTVFGSLEIDYQKHEVWRNGNPIDLTTMEFEVLTFLSKNSGIVISRDDIYEKVKGLDSDTFDRSIDVLISRLRGKLGEDPKKPEFIKTIWGSGYKFIAKQER